LRHGTLPISVLKPVQGVEDGLFENLESFCRQTHPRFELIVGAAEPDAPALDVVRAVKAKYPDLSIQIVVGEWSTGHNPKIRNLRHLLAKAQHPAILVSDADVRVDPDYLSIMAGALERPNVGLVTNLVVGAGAQSLGSACHNALLSGFLTSAIAASNNLGHHPIVMGKSMLFRRDALLNIGGFAAAADVLAEDYLLGKATLHAGYAVRVLGYSICAMNQAWTMLRAIQRYQRWAQIRRQLSPAAFALEPLGFPMIWAMLLLLANLVQFIDTRATFDASHLHLHALCVAAAHLATFVQAAVATRLRNAEQPFRAWLVAPIASLLALLAWAQAWIVTVVVWRGHAFRIGSGSRLTPLAVPRTQARQVEAA
jgi:ceramide glucosyltransferase